MIFQKESANTQKEILGNDYSHFKSGYKVLIEFQEETL